MHGEGDTWYRRSCVLWSRKDCMWHGWSESNHPDHQKPDSIHGKPDTQHDALCARWRTERRRRRRRRVAFGRSKEPPLQGSIAAGNTGLRWGPLPDRQVLPPVAPSPDTPAAHRKNQRPPPTPDCVRDIAAMHCEGQTVRRIESGNVASCAWFILPKSIVSALSAAPPFTPRPADSLPLQIPTPDTLVDDTHFQIQFAFVTVL